MTTSGVTAWSMTANDLIGAALKELAIIDPGTDPEADEAADCLVRLNAMLKSWQARGVTLFREQTISVTTTPATASVSLDAKVRSIASARLVVSATYERPLWPWNRRDYFGIPNKTAAGDPTMYYLDRQRDAAVLYLWPVPATAKTIKLDYDRIVDTVTELTQTLDIREEYQETVYANLAVRITGIFGQQAGTELLQRAALLEQQMFDAERPDSYRFETDYDYSYA